ncbi:peptide chain release factor N(5)-glutamine methyltransferase [Guyparkeria sp. 1SP6A2]|nr:peptide chain release factor N(5)-glutamine methyltransferase [Guyparkeria sp. 1SP6A2]
MSRESRVSREGCSIATSATLGECLRDGARRISAGRGGEAGEALFEARLLAGHVTGLSTAGLLMRGADVIDAPTRQRLDELVDRRAAGEPVAYLVGERGFWKHRFRCRPGVLIPRPDTETLVEWALSFIPVDVPDFRVLDLGTGSGAIALSLAAERPAATVYAVDRSSQALDLARENMGFVSEQCAPTGVALWRGDWLSAVAPASLDLLVSNPPYIADDDPHLGRGDVRHEPRTALVAGEDGLADYRRLLESTFAVLRPGGRVLFEHGFEQAPAVAMLMRQAGLTAIEARADLAGHPRVTMGVKGA